MSQQYRFHRLPYGAMRCAYCALRGLHELAPLRDVAGVKDVRVKGAIGAIEVENLHDLDWLKMQFVEAGIWLRPFGNVIYTMPPFVVTREELSAITGAIAEILPRWSARIR